jgi:hypothetical protein
VSCSWLLALCAFGFRRWNCERRIAIANEIGEELDREFVARIGGDLMNAVGSFVETLARPVDGFWLALHLGAIRSFDNVYDYCAGMAVWRIGFAGCVSDLNDGGFEVVSI